MDNTIPFNPTSCTVRTEQITVDVSILSVLNHAASPGRHKPDANIYLAAIAPDMELTIIMEEDAPHILPCFDEEDAQRFLSGAVCFQRHARRLCHPRQGRWQPTRPHSTDHPSNG